MSAPDIIYKKLTIEQVSSTPEEAEHYAAESLEVQRKRLADKGFTISHDVQRLRCKLNMRYFVRLTVFVFGEKTALEKETHASDWCD